MSTGSTIKSTGVMTPWRSIIEAQRIDVFIISLLAVRTFVPYGSFLMDADSVRWLFANRSPIKLFAAPLSSKTLQSLFPNLPFNRNVRLELCVIAPQITSDRRRCLFLGGSFCNLLLSGSTSFSVVGKGSGGPGMESGSLTVLTGSTLSLSESISSETAAIARVAAASPWLPRQSAFRLGAADCSLVK